MRKRRFGVIKVVSDLVFTNSNGGEFEFMQGTVKFFHDGDGYGFIETEEVDDDVFFHVSDLPEGTDDPEEGDEVEFDQEEGDRGPKAVNLEVL